MGIIKTLSKKISNFTKNKRIDRKTYGTPDANFLWKYAKEFDNEYQSELSSIENRITVYDQMFRSDASILAAYQGNSKPIESAKFWAEPGGELLRDKKAAQAMEDMLLNQGTPTSMSQSFQTFLSQALFYLGYGFSVFEIIEDIKDGKAVIDRFAPRPQKTIQWNRDDNGKVIAVDQNSFWIRSNVSPIPIDKTIIFTNNMQSNDLEGIGFFRQQYRPWKMKNKLLPIMGVGFARFLAGVPVGEMPASNNVDGYSKMKSILKNWTSHESSHMVMPPGYKVDIKEGSFSGANAALDYVRYLDQQIHLSTFSQWLLLGMSTSGSWALSTDQTDFLMIYLQSILDYICSVINNAYRKYHWLNFGDSLACPRLKAKVLEEDYQKSIDNVLNTIDKYVFEPYPELQSWLAKKIDVPEPKGGFIKAAEEKMMEDGQDEGQDDDLTDDPNNSNNNLNNAIKDGAQELKSELKKYKRLSEERQDMEERNSFHRSLYPVEERIIGEKQLKEMDNFLTKNKNELNKKLKKIVDKQRKSIIKQYKAGKKANKIDVPEMRNYQNEIISYMEASAMRGLKDVEREMKIGEDNKNKLNALKNELKKWSKKKAELIADKHKTDIIFNICRIMEDASLSGKFAKPVTEELNDLLVDGTFRQIISAFTMRGTKDN